MKREFLVKIIVPPVVVGLALGAVLIAFFSRNPVAFSPIYGGAVLSDTVQDADTSAVVDKSFDDIKAGDCIGTVSASFTLPVVADAPYHMLGDVLSYRIGSGRFGESGYVYLQTDRNNLKKLKNDISFSAQGCFDKHDYVLVQTERFDTEDALLHAAPAVGKCVIIYAQDAGTIGLRSTYTALIFEEVQL